MSLDETIAAIIAAQPVRTIDDVLRVMRELDRVLPHEDGVRWFNLLYLRVTEGVKDEPPGGGWSDPVWLEQLDVVFANLYFAALMSWARKRGTTSRCWRSLFEARRRKDVARIQFALAGMNAHINHDLALALVHVSQERGDLPDRGSAQFRDFERVNELLEIVQEKVKVLLLSPIAGEVDRHSGRVDDVIALWKIRKARETAWVNAEILWELRGVPLVGEKFVRNLDRLVGLSSKGLLVPTTT